jgi:drug efflux transport system permease protein
MNRRRIKAIAKKEYLHVIRDPRSLMAALGMPILLLALFGYALSLDVDRIQTAIYDQDQTTASGELVHSFKSSRYFEVSEAKSYGAIEQAIMHNEVLIGVVIPSDYSRNMALGKKTDIQLLIDGSDSNTAELAKGYAQGLVREHAANTWGKQKPASIEARIRTWYNSDLKSRNYIVPGLISVILMIISSLLTSLTIAKEWENGTMEQLLSTPVRPFEMLFGKLSVYFVLGFLDMIVALVLGVFVLGTPFRGSVILLFFAGFLFLTGALAFGMLISAATRSQHMAFQVATVTSFLPAFLLSGFMYAIENMPAAVQAFTYLIPARYFVTILKGVFLKGVGLNVLWAEFLFLAAYATGVCLVTTRKLRQKMA